MNLFVSNLGFHMQSSDLKNIFAPYGEVSAAKVVMDRETNKSRGFGFVEMADDAAGNEAIAKLNGKIIDGRPINVSIARPKESNTRGFR